MRASAMIEIPQAVWKKIGGRAATRIVKNSDKGKDKNDKTFKPYSPDYAEKKAAGKASSKGVSASRQTSPPNLRLTSTMLNSISAQSPTKQGVDIVFRDGLKVEGNAKRGRDIYGLSTTNTDEIEKTLMGHISKNVEKYARESIDIKIG
jgi:hypothetical protein